MNNYRYVPSPVEADEYHAACPSCWQHFPEADRQAFITHLGTVHVSPAKPQVRAKQPALVPQVNEPSSMETDRAEASGEHSKAVIKLKDDARTRRKLDFIDALNNLVVAVKKMILNCD